MPEAATIAGDVMAASYQQSLDWLGETFTITNQVASQYATATTTALPDDAQFTAKGIFDNSRSSSMSGEADVRGTEKAIVIGTKTTDGEPLPFTPGIGDLVESGALASSIRRVDELRGLQGVTAFYRLVMEDA